MRLLLLSRQAESGEGSASQAFATRDEWARNPVRRLKSRIRMSRLTFLTMKQDADEPEVIFDPEVGRFVPPPESGPVPRGFWIASLGAVSGAIFGALLGALLGDPGWRLGEGFGGAWIGFFIGWAVALLVARFVRRARRRGS
jgi:hypothetical protein